MTRHLDAEHEAHREKLRKMGAQAIDGGIGRALDDYEVVLTGLAFKIEAWECLITLKAEKGGKAVVAFVGADTPLSALVKAEREAKRDKLRWREDRYGNNGA